MPENEYDQERRLLAERCAEVWAVSWVAARKRLSSRLRELRQGESYHFDLPIVDEVSCDIASSVVQHMLDQHSRISVPPPVVDCDKLARAMMQQLAPHLRVDDMSAGQIADIAAEWRRRKDGGEF